MFTRFFPIVSIWEIWEGREKALPEVVTRIRSYMPGETTDSEAEGLYLQTKEN
jgi:hypothetical protein